MSVLVSWFLGGKTKNFKIYFHKLRSISDTLFSFSLTFISSGLDNSLEDIIPYVNSSFLFKHFTGFSPFFAFLSINSICEFTEFIQGWFPDDSASLFISSLADKAALANFSSDINSHRLVAFNFVLSFTNTCIPSPLVLTGFCGFVHLSMIALDVDFSPVPSGILN